MPITDPGAVPTQVANVTPMAAEWANAVRDRTVNRFSTTSARDAAITSPTEGMLCYVTGTDRFYRYTGSAWRIVPGMGKYPEGVFVGYRNASLSTGTGPVSAGVTIDVETLDPDTCYASGAYTVPRNGLYQVNFAAQAQLNNNPQVFAAGIDVGGTWKLQGTTFTIRGGSSGDLMASAGSGLLVLDAGDLLGLEVYNNGGNSISLIVGSAAFTYLHVYPVTTW